ncbi:MAG: hypothetical protein WBV27_11080 [Trichococcus sp.]|uniref:hypothetical protein n=1 Tax=Trichococcus sp. TaxID=1985464 RepID=UPI003C537240
MSSIRELRTRHEIEAAVEDLSLLNEDELLIRLGNISSKVADEPNIVNLYPESPIVLSEEVEFKSEQYLDGFMKLGRRILSRWEKETYDLICGSDEQNKTEREKLMSAAFGVGTFATALTMLLVSLGVAISFATLISTIIAKRYFETAHEEFCIYWKGNLPE